MRAPHYRSSRWPTFLVRWFAVCAAAALAVTVAPAYARIPEGCTELGVAITEHSCFHSAFGPFETVMATGGSTLSKETPGIDPIHTEFRIGLTGEYSVVTYMPELSGAWAVFLDKDVPLQVLAGPADARPSIFDEAGTTGCDALPILHVFELTKGTKYRLVFGPTAERSVVAVIENVDAFLTQNGRDADGDGFGSRSEVLESPCEPPQGFAPNTRDCNDADPLVHPGAEEGCGDGVDQNCNGSEGDVGLPCRVGAGACVAEGQALCAAAGAVATCEATPREGAEETCNGVDDDCSGKIDDAEGLCHDPDRPTCIRTGMAAACGCRLDLDCGSVTSGRVCNVETGACEDGCSLLPGHNACGTGEVCGERSATCEPAMGQGGADGVGGQGAATGDASVSGAGGKGSSASSSDGGVPGSSMEGGGSVEDGGCGCRVAGQRPARGGGVAFGLALFLGYARARRRAKRASPATTTPATTPATSAPSRPAPTGAA